MRSDKGLIDLRHRPPDAPLLLGDASSSLTECREEPLALPLLSLVPEVSYAQTQEAVEVLECGIGRAADLRAPLVARGRWAGHPASQNDLQRPGNGRSGNRGRSKHRD